MYSLWNGLSRIDIRPGINGLDVAQANANAVRH